MEIKHKIPNWLITTFAGLVTAFVLFAVADEIYSFSQHFKSTKPDNTISISAQGKVSATPDLATVSLSVVTQAPTAVSAQDQATKKANKLVVFVKQQGIAEADITTSQFNLNPMYDYRDGKNNLSGYQAVQSITVKVHSVDKSTDKLNKILGGATDNGANEVLGVYFTFNDPDSLKQAARKQAIAHAKEKAAELASEAGLRLGKVVSVSESSSNYPVPLPYGIGGGLSEPSVKNPDIQTGSQEIVVDMTLVFEVK